MKPIYWAIAIVVLVIVGVAAVVLYRKRQRDDAAKLAKEKEAAEKGKVPTPAELGLYPKVPDVVKPAFIPSPLPTAQVEPKEQDNTPEIDFGKPATNSLLPFPSK